MADDMVGEGPNLTEASIPIAVEHPPEQAGMFAGLKAEWDKLPGWGKVAVVGAAVGLGFIVFERLRSGGLGLPLPSSDTSGGSGSGFFGGATSPTGGSNGTSGDVFPPIPGIPPLTIPAVPGIPDFPGSGIGPEGNGSGPGDGQPSGPSAAASLSVAQRVANLINGAAFQPAPPSDSILALGPALRAAAQKAAAQNAAAAANVRGESNKSTAPSAPSVGPTYALTAPTAAMRAMQYAQAHSSPPPQAPAPIRVPTGVARRYGLDGG